jgi:hypothetical protein
MHKREHRPCHAGRIMGRRADIERMRSCGGGSLEKCWHGKLVNTSFKDFPGSVKLPGLELVIVVARELTRLRWSCLAVYKTTKTAISTYGNIRGFYEDKQEVQLTRNAVLQ